MSNHPTTTEEDIKAMSGPLIGSNGAAFRPVDYERFKAKFGVEPTICTLAWNRIVANLNNHPPIEGFSCLAPHHILYALFFLKCYPTARQTTPNLGKNVGTRQFRHYAYFLIRQIAALSSQVVSKNR